jgi:hypothetical protein
MASAVRELSRLDAGHDVEHGFSIEARRRRAADVFNRAGRQPWADRLDKKRAFSPKPARPIGIVRNDVYWRVVGRSLRIDAGRGATRVRV